LSEHIAMPRHCLSQLKQRSAKLRALVALRLLVAEADRVSWLLASVRDLVVPPVGERSR